MDTSKQYDQRLELAARAAFAAFGHDLAPSAPPMPWEQAPEDFRITFRMVADAVIMVTEPLLRMQIATEIETGPGCDEYGCNGTERAARIARCDHDQQRP